jgi:hypothetical protein
MLVATQSSLMTVHCCDVDWLSHVDGGATASDHTDQVLRWREVRSVRPSEGMAPVRVRLDLAEPDDNARHAIEEALAR